MTFDPADELFDWVSMPNVSEPVAKLAPDAPTLGNLTMTPLLLTLKAETGFCTCRLEFRLIRQLFSVVGTQLK